MEDQKPTKFTFEIDNFSEKEALIPSPKFLSGGCEWYLSVYPKGDFIEDHLALYLCVANPESLQLGWKRRATCSFVLLNQSGKELHREPESCSLLFCAQFSERGWANAVPLKKLQEEGFLEKNELIVKVQVQVLEVVDEGEDTAKETLNYKGFQILYSQVSQVSQIFHKHPDFDLNFKPKSQLVKTTYLNLLLHLIEKLDKPQNSFSKTELRATRSELIDLTEAGFKLDWLETKLDEVSLEREKANDGGYRVQELEEQVKNLKAKVVSLEKTVSDLTEQNKKQKLSPH